MTRYGVRLVACHCRYDIGKARRELGYQPVVTFREGIKEPPDAVTGRVGRCGAGGMIAN